MAVFTYNQKKMREAAMHRTVTVGCAIAATSLWIAGQAAHSMALFAAAGLFELVSWKRMLARVTP